MQEIKILSIGNSYSQDATRYLHQIAKADGINIKVVNLYIGGCPLSLHYKNILNDDRAYLFEINGINTGLGVSVREAIQTESYQKGWDYITMQQASHYSVDYDTYQPYLDTLSEYVYKYAPKAKQLIHQTWAYEQGSENLLRLGYTEQSDMFTSLESAYNKAAEAIGADGMLPSGMALQNLLKYGIKKIHRDPIHASLGLGRYTLGLTWYKYLTDNDLSLNNFSDFDEDISLKDIEIAKKAANDAVRYAKNIK